MYMEAIADTHQSWCKPFNIVLNSSRNHLLGVGLLLSHFATLLVINDVGLQNKVFEFMFTLWLLRESYIYV